MAVRISDQSDLAVLREFNRPLTAHPRVARCGHRIRRGAVGAADEILQTTIYCDNVWLCPTCAAGHADHWRQKLQQLLAASVSAGEEAALLTLTVAHSRDDGLDPLMNHLDAGWLALKRGSGWRTDQRRFGIAHYVRITEVVHGPEHGWHPHFHVLLLHERTPAGRSLDELHDRLATRFTHGVRGAGGAAQLTGQDLRLLDPAAHERIDWYCTKGARASRSGASRTPAAILADLMTTGEGIDLVKEFDTTFTYGKHRRYSPSTGLRQLLGVR